MTSEKPQVRLEEWLDKELDSLMKRNKLKSRTKTLHQYIRDLKQQKEELAKVIKRLREEARYHRQKAEKAEKLAAKDQQKPKTDSKAKPQWKKRWRPVPGFQYNLWNQRSDGGHGCPFQEGFVWQKDCQNCRKSTPDRFHQCVELHNQHAQRKLR
jgi:hypothetical protein